MAQQPSASPTASSAKDNTKTRPQTDNKSQKPSPTPAKGQNASTPAKEQNAPNTGTKTTTNATAQADSNTKPTTETVTSPDKQEERSSCFTILKRLFGLTSNSDKETDPDKAAAAAPTSTNNTPGLLEKLETVALNDTVQKAQTWVDQTANPGIGAAADTITTTTTTTATQLQQTTASMPTAVSQMYNPYGTNVRTGQATDGGIANNGGTSYVGNTGNNVEPGNNLARNMQESDGSYKNNDLGQSVSGPGPDSGQMVVAQEQEVEGLASMEEDANVENGEGEDANVVNADEDDEEEDDDDAELDEF